MGKTSMAYSPLRVNADGSIQRWISISSSQQGQDLEAQTYIQDGELRLLPAPSDKSYLFPYKGVEEMSVDRYIPNLQFGRRTVFRMKYELEEPARRRYDLPWLQEFVDRCENSLDAHLLYTIQLVGPHLRTLFGDCVSLRSLPPMTIEVTT